MSPKKSLPREFPVIVERGSTGRKGTAKIYSTPVKVQGQSYDSFTVVHYYLKKRCRERFNDYERAFAFAEEKAIQLGNDEIDALSLTGDDRRIYVAATEALKPMGISLDLAAREYVAARKLLGDVSVIESAKFYDRHGKSVIKKGTLSEILQAMLKSLKDDERSKYHIRDIGRHVGLFVKKFRCRIDEIDTGQINQWLRSLKVGGRTRDNHRDSVHNFFHFARSEGYLPEDRPTAADKTKRVNDAGAENAVFEVEEMQKMLIGAQDWIIPSLAIKAFSGIRTEEMLRLKWEDIKFDQDVLFLGKKVTKTKQRRIVPLLPNLKLWLARHRQVSGRICARWGTGHTLSKAWSNRAKEVGVVYKKNGMRNSYISYRIAVVKNVAQIALESGNSPRVIQADYLELVTEDAGKKWFEIIPDSKAPLTRKRVKKR